MLIVHHVYIVYTVIEYAPYTIYHPNVVPLRAVTSYHFISHNLPHRGQHRNSPKSSPITRPLGDGVWKDK